jgi:hypothetical protein
MKVLLPVMMACLMSVAHAADEQESKKPSRVIAETFGDLDKDGVAEKLIVLDSGLQGDFGTERVVLIFKKAKKHWALWHSSQGSVLPSAHGGMMGDPFEEIKIDRGSIVIRHFGGSRYKWSYVHRYRLEGSAWKLIGATINFGAPCEDFTNFDYNLLTGKATYEQALDVCPDMENLSDAKDLKETLQLPASQLPDMDGFYPGANRIDLKSIGREINF